MLLAHTVAHLCANSLNFLTSVPNTDHAIFGVSPDYDPQHGDALESLARSFGAAFVGNCFMVHREIAALHADYAAELLTEAFNQGLLPQ